MRSHFSLKKGFTLLELIVAMAIMSILISIGVNAFNSSLIASRNQRRKADLALIAGALESYKANNIDSSYPNTTYSGLCQMGSYPLVPAFLTKLPFDPSSTDPCKPGGGSGPTYVYTANCNGTICSSYLLSATLEGSAQSYSLNQNGEIGIGPTSTPIPLPTATPVPPTATPVPPTPTPTRTPTPVPPTPTKTPTPIPPTPTKTPTPTPTTIMCTPTGGACTKGSTCCSGICSTNVCK